MTAPGTPDVEIALMTPEDAMGVYAVLVAAFNGKVEADLVVALLQDDAVVLPLVARIDGVVVGACVFSRVTLHASDGDWPAICLAPVGVAPALQRSGVGGALIRTGLASLTAADESLVLVLGDPSYYGRFGFDAKTAAPIRTPWDGPYQQALVLDGSPTGPCRAKYPKAFDAFL